MPGRGGTYVFNAVLLEAGEEEDDEAGESELVLPLESELLVEEAAESVESSVVATEPGCCPASSRLETRATMLFVAMLACSQAVCPALRAPKASAQSPTTKRLEINALLTGSDCSSWSSTSDLECSEAVAAGTASWR